MISGEALSISGIHYLHCKFWFTNLANAVDEDQRYGSLCIGKLLTNTVSGPKKIKLQHKVEL